MFLIGLVIVVLSFPVSSQIAPSSMDFLSEAQVALAHGQEQKALKSIDRFLDQLKQGTLIGERRTVQLDRAAGILIQLRENDPQSFKTGYLLGEIRFLQNQYSQALEILNQLRTSGLRDTDYLNLVGMCHGGLNQLPEAARSVIAAINLSPQRADLYFNLAGLYQKAGDNRAAIEVLDRAIGKGMVTPEIYFALGLSHYNLSNFSLAKSNFGKAIKARPGFSKGYFYLARCSSRLGSPTEAITSYRKAIALNPNDFLSYSELGELLIELQKPIEGIRFLEKAVEISPGHAESHYQLGKIYSKQGKETQAIPELEQAIALNPNQDGAYQELARLYMKTGNKEKAQALMNALNDLKQKRKEQYEKKVSGNPSQ